MKLPHIEIRFVVSLLLLVAAFRGHAFAAGHLSASERCSAESVKRAFISQQPGFPFGEVAVVPPYAIVDWSRGETGGEALFAYDASDGWARIAGGGGYLDTAALTHMGIPESLAIRLSIARSKIPRGNPSRYSYVDCTNAAGHYSADAVQAVEMYYLLWNARRYSRAYAMLSGRYQSRNAYPTWLASHQIVDGISLIDARSGSTRADVEVQILAHDHGAAAATYKGSWKLVKERGDWKLDTPALIKI